MLRRLRSGEWIALGGLLGLVATLFLEWFTVAADARCDAGPGRASADVCEALTAFAPVASVDPGWGTLGRPWSDFLVLTGLAVVVALVMTLRAGPGRPTYGAVVSLVLAGAVTGLVTLLTAIRVLLARPNAELPGFADAPGVTVSTGIGPGGWIGLAALLVLVIGLWVAIADDRTDAADSAFDPPAPRPVPDVPPAGPRDAPAPTPEP